MTWYIITFLVGVIAGAILYSKFLDKPETIQKINKQKVRKGGLFRNIFNSKRKKDV